ncbi:MAG: hypothetical protein RR123_06535, partial [Clostridia bacterium]
MGKKLSYEEVKKYIESFGNNLLSKEYKGNKVKLNILCKCGRNSFSRSLASIKQHESYYCDDCIRESISKSSKTRNIKNNKLKNYNEVVKHVEKMGC